MKSNKPRSDTIAIYTRYIAIKKSTIKKDLKLLFKSTMRYIWLVYNKKIIIFALTLLSFGFLYISILYDNTKTSEYYKHFTDNTHVYSENDNLRVCNIENVFSNNYKLSKDAKNAYVTGNITIYGLNHTDKDSAMIGRITLALRYKNLTYFLEQKYDLPENLLLSVILQESTGVDLLPNSSNDGGFGIVHMQPIVAYNFGLLNIYGDCRDMVNKTHGEALKLEITTFLLGNNENREYLCKLDDRLNNYLNLDCAARILKHYSLNPVDGKADAIIRDAIMGYAGTKRADEYYANVMRTMKLLKNKRYIKDIETIFNDNNDNNITFYDYLKEYWMYNENYL